MLFSVPPVTKHDRPIKFDISARLAVAAADRGIIAGPAVGFVDPEEVQALVNAIRKHHAEGDYDDVEVWDDQW